MGVPETSKRGSSFGAVKSRGLPPSDPLLRSQWSRVCSALGLCARCDETRAEMFGRRWRCCMTSEGQTMKLVACSVDGKLSALC